MNSEIQRLLDLPQDKFIPEAFQVILGRMPDDIGITHYANRMCQYSNRELIIAELVTSNEARISPRDDKELAKLIRRYYLVRKLPLGKSRWKLLKILTKKEESSEFNWNMWAKNYCEKSRIDSEKETEECEIASEPEMIVTLSRSVEELNHRVNRLSDEIKYMQLNPSGMDITNSKKEVDTEGELILISGEVSGVFLQIRKGYKRYL